MQQYHFIFHFYIDIWTKQTLYPIKFITSHFITLFSEPLHQFINISWKM